MFTEHKNEARSFFAFLFGFFRSVRRFEVLFAWTGYHSDCIWQKRECSPQCRLDWDFLTAGEKEHRKACVYKKICIFDSSRFWSVGHLFGQDARWSAFAAFIYSVRGHDFELPWHWDELTVGTAIFHGLHSHYICWLNVTMFTHLLRAEIIITVFPAARSCCLR